MGQTRLAWLAVRKDGLLAVADAEGSRQLLRLLGFVFAAVLRLGVVVVLVPLAVLAAPEESRIPALQAGLSVLAWNVVYGVGLVGTWGPRGRVPTGWWLADVGVVCGVVLTQRWTTPSALIGVDGTGWAVVYAAMIMVGWQLYKPRGVAVVACGVTLGALVAAARGTPAGMTAPFAAELVWVSSEPVMARLLYHVLGRAAEKADRDVADAATARERSAIAAARRRDERTFAATLHDTAASTLLMVGLGAVRRDASWLRHQAKRDLALLAASRDGSNVDAHTILMDTVVAEIVAEYPVLDVTVGAIPPVPLQPAVRDAVRGALREAMTNVVRHALTTDVTITGSVSDERVQLDIVDTGPGFRIAEIPAGRRGIADSLVARMAGVAGEATVWSEPGRGTWVRLSWAL